MAIWQFHIYFIPKRALINKYGQVPTQLLMDKQGWNDYIQNSDLDDEPDFEDALTIHWWRDLNIGLDTLLPLLKQLGEIQSWMQDTEGLKSFGDPETNDISVCFDNTTNIVEEVACRIDLRHPDKNFINKMLSLARQFDCLLMDKQGRLYQPTRISLFEIIKQSNAHRFVDDPEQYLNDLSEGIVAPE